MRERVPWWGLVSAAAAPVLPIGGWTVAAATVLMGLLGWFGVELAADDGRAGVAERVTAGAQALWPLAAVAVSRRPG